MKTPKEYDVKRQMLMRDRRSAFTLLEILVVLAILGMGLALITTMATTTARYSERVEEETSVQLACQNLMNSILAGGAIATVGVELPIPEVPNWSTSVELLDGSISNLVAIRITAQRYQTYETPSLTEPNGVLVTRVPEEGRRFVLKEWARREEIKTRVIRTNSDGSLNATDGTGETVWSDLNSENSLEGGGLGGEEANFNDPFGIVDQMNASAVGGNINGGLNENGEFNLNPNY